MEQQLLSGAVLPVPLSSWRDERAYLQVTWQETDGLPARLKVIPTELGRKRLNRFWVHWLRQEILQKTNYAVEVYGKYLLVTDDGKPERLYAVVMGIARQIRPLPRRVKAALTGDFAADFTVNYGKTYRPFGFVIADLIESPPRGFAVGDFGPLDAVLFESALSCGDMDRACDLLRNRAFCMVRTDTGASIRNAVMEVELRIALATERF